MRLKFEHALAARDVADPVVVQVQAHSPHAHLAGFGETLAREYVTGESADSVLRDLQEVFAPLLADFAPESFAEALELIDALPIADEGRVVTAARCAIELALLDLASRAFRREMTEMAGWLDLPGFGAPGCLRKVRYSGIVVGRSEQKLKWFLRAQRWYGLRDFKLKVATDGWQQKLEWTTQALGGALRKKNVSLRVDANAGWSLAEAHDAVELLDAHGVDVVEQPLPEANDPDLPWLAEQSSCRIMVDESLLTESDADRLIQDGGVRVLNIRLAKNGGLIPALRIARRALQADLEVQLGCMVGETSLLAAAGARFLQICPRVSFVEGAFGKWLAHDDIVQRRVQFGYRGRLRPRDGFGWGVDVDSSAVSRLAEESVTIRI